MFIDFLTKYWGSLLVGGIVLAVVGLIVFFSIKGKKQGKSSCGGCAGCPMSGKCHKK